MSSFDDEDSWDNELISSMQGTPRKPIPGRMSPQIPPYINEEDLEIIEVDSEGESDDFVTDSVFVIEDNHQRGETRPFHLTKQDIEKYRRHKDKECTGCKTKRRYQRFLAHSAQCMQSIMEHALAEGDPDGRREEATKMQNY